MIWLKAFVAAFLATLVFHQGLFGLFYLADILPKAPYNMTPAGPLGVPSVLSLAFWGGLWGLPLWALVRRSTGMSHWLISLAFGAVGPTAVAMLVVFPLKGIAVVPMMIIGGLILNGAWGLGTSLLMRVLGERPAPGGRPAA